MADILTNPALLGPYFEWHEYNLATHTTPDGIALAANPQRVAILWGTDGVAHYYVSTLPGAVQGVGLAVVPGTSGLAITFRDFGALVCADWYTDAPAITVVANVIEVLYRPPEQ